MWNGKTVSVVLPAYNEEKVIRSAVESFLSLDFVDEVLVVDNNSTDSTAQEVKATKARLIQEKRQGYGYAIRRGLEESTTNLVVICEPDGTFLARDITKLLAYSDEFDLILGTRTSSSLIWQGANMGKFLKWGNWVVAKMLEFLFNGPSLTDVGCTYRLINRESLRKILPHCSVGASHFSPEMMILAILHNLRIVEIPLNYCQRIGASKITGKLWRAFILGLRMIMLILRYRIFRR